MKIIHTADLHIDSRLSANLPAEKRKIRKAEVLRSFARLCEYAAANEVEAVLIAGDLFDSAAVSRAARDSVLAAVKSAPGVQFYYLRGNHDEGGALTGSPSAGNGDASGAIPANLHLFESRWTSYNLDPSGSAILYGAELGTFSGAAAAAGFVADGSKINIVMLHGQEVLSASSPEDIPIKAFKNKGIDYFALGHIHSYKEGQIDGRGTYAYPGAIEGRGFDELGEKGFVLLTVEDKKINAEFVPFAKRIFHEVSVELSEEDDMPSILKRIHLSCDEIPEKDLVKVVLTGHTGVDFDVDEDRILREFGDRFFFLKVKDESTIKVHYEDFLNDKSLKGEFVRLMEKQEINEEDKAEIVEIGIRALMGEEL